MRLEWRPGTISLTDPDDDETDQRPREQIAAPKCRLWHRRSFTTRARSWTNASSH
jgi:hypothetical protein